MFRSLTRTMLLRTLLCGEKYSAILGRCYSQATINLSEPAVQHYLKHLLLEHNELHSKSKRSTQETNRLIEIQPIAGVLEERIMLFDSIESLKELNKKDNKDEEMKKMIKTEAEIYLRRIKEMDNDLVSVLLQPILTDGGILLEVSAGAGGQEAMLFAKELFETYYSYTNYKSWAADVASFDKSDIGGIRKGSMLIEGFGVPELMRMEAGVHRVQRIPATEKSGRIHTSTVSVAVLPQAKDIELDLPDKDLVIETKRASGAGGQHVNTTDSAVRIIHVPSGIAVECQEGRSQIKNKEIAMQKLKALLLQKQQQEQTSMIQQERKSQVGSGDRNEKIRTYNFPQDRITEHRPGGGSTHSLKLFMQGNDKLETLQLNLLRQIRYQTLMNEIEEFKKNYPSSDQI